MVIIYANLCRNAANFSVIRHNITCPESSFHYIKACGILANFTQHFQFIVHRFDFFLSFPQTKRDFQNSVSTLNSLSNFYRIVENLKVLLVFKAY